MQTKNEDYWKEKLSSEQYAVLRQKGTEPAFSGKLLHNYVSGTYTCAGCGTVLFRSQHKFDSSSGWPSFYDVAQYKKVRLTHDKSHGMKRIEVSCASCGGHLGHLFDDAHDQPTGKRYCINSAALEFTEDKNEKGAV